jgi:hypothetical protein
MSEKDAIKKALPSSKQSQTVSREFKTQLLDSLMEYFKELCKKRDIHLHHCKTHPDLNKFEFSVPLLATDVNYLPVLNVLLKFQRNGNVSFLCNFMVCHMNLDTVTLKSKDLIIMLSRYFLKINNTFKCGYFALNPANGQIMYKDNFNFQLNSYATQWTSERFMEHFKSMLRIYLTDMASTIKTHFIRILYLTNCVSLTKYEKLMKSRFQPTVDPEAKDLDLLKDLLKEAPNSEPPIEEKKEKRPSSDEKSPVPRTQSSHKILLKIRIISVEDEILVAEGGFGSITMAKVCYKIPDQPNIADKRNEMNKELKKYMIIKRTKESNDKKALEIKHEIEILKRISNEFCTFIGEYYENEQGNAFTSDNVMNKDPPQLLMVVYPITLETYLANTASFLSLDAKFRILKDISEGILCLTKAGVLHLDLKFRNIMLDTKLYPKIIDFGESRYKGFHSDERPGYTIPYVSPEQLQETIQYNDKMDVYAFGVMLCEMVFQEKIYDISVNIIDEDGNDFSYGRDQLKKLTYKTKLSEKNAQICGPKHVMKLVRLIVLMCIDSNPEYRPTIFAITQMMNLIHHYLTIMYA